MSLSEFLKSKKSLNGFKERVDPDIVGLDFDIISQEHENGVQMAESCCIDHMGKHFAWMRGNQNCFTGFANTGKTQGTLYLQTMKSFVDDWKWVIWSPEMRKANFVDGKVKVHYNRLAYEIMATMTGKTPFEHISKKFNIPFMTLDEKEHWVKWIEKHFIFLEPKEKKMDDIYNTMQRIYDDYGIDGILIDPFKNIEMDGNVRDDIFLHKAFAKFQDLAVTTNASMNWIAHPKSNVSRIVKKGNEEVLQVCNQYMLSGGAAWDNSMDGIYSWHRPNLLVDPSDSAVEFHNLKERDQLLVAEKGVVKDISFNMKTRRYLFDGYDPLDDNPKQKDENKFPTTGNETDSFEKLNEIPIGELSTSEMHELADKGDDAPF